MIEEEMGAQIIQNEGNGKNVIQIKVTPREIGVKKKREEWAEEIGEVNGEVIKEIIEDVQNDDTASITLSTS